MNLQRTISAAFNALKDPHLASATVAAVGESTGHYHLIKLSNEMMRDEVGSKVLNEKPDLRLNIESLKHLEKLDRDTLGGATLAIMKAHGLDLGDRERVRNLPDELAYVMQRYRQVHDLLHVVLGLPFSVCGEVGLKWFEFKQTKLPMTFLAASFGTGKVENLKLAKDMTVFGIKSGQLSANFMNIYYENLWNINIHTFREQHDFLSSADYDLPSLDAIWNPSINQKPLINHYLSCIQQIKSNKNEKNAARLQVFESALRDLSTR